MQHDCVKIELCPTLRLIGVDAVEPVRICVYCESGVGVRVEIDPPVVLAEAIGAGRVKDVNLVSARCDRRKGQTRMPLDAGPGPRSIQVGVGPVLESTASSSGRPLAEDGIRDRLCVVIPILFPGRRVYVVSDRVCRVHVPVREHAIFFPVKGSIILPRGVRVVGRNDRWPHPCRDSYRRVSESPPMDYDPSGVDAELPRCIPRPRTCKLVRLHADGEGRL